MTIEVELLTRANHLVDAGDAFIEGAVDHHAAHLDALGLAQGSLQTHARGLHGIGVARGLAVSIVPDANGKPTAQVAPGVAVDDAGRHVLLAVGGVAETSPNAVEPSGSSAQVAVTDAGAALPVPTVTAAQQMILTIQHFERAEQDDSDETPTLRHTPWLRWLAPGDLAANPDCIPLAQATLSPTAAPTLQPGARAKSALDAASLSVVATGASAGIVQEQAVARLAPFVPSAPAMQGIEMSAASPAFVLRLGADSGQSVSSLELDATSISANGALTVSNALTVKQAGTFTNGLTVNGSCTVDQFKANQAGAFTNGLTVGNVGNTANMLTVNGACTVANSLTVKQAGTFTTGLTVGMTNTAANMLTVNGACTVTNRLTVDDACFVKNGLTVGTTSNAANVLIVEGGCQVISTLRALNGLVVNGDTQLSGSATVQGPVTLTSQVASGLGPILSLQNTGGGANAGAAIDFYGYEIAGSGAAARVQSYDDGDYSGHLSFQTKAPGGPGNSLVERMRIQSGGNISTTGAILVVNGAGSEQMYIGGDGAGGDAQFGSMNSGVTNISAWNWSKGTWMNVAGLNFLSHSDVRSKESIESIAGALDKVMLLRGVSFRWKSPSNEGAAGTRFAPTEDNARQIGLIAQEVIGVIPEAVVEQRTGSLGIAFNAVTALLVEAVKEQQKHILRLEARIGALENRTS